MGLKDSLGLPKPTRLKEPEFPPSVLFGLSFGFLLGRGGVSLLSVRQRGDLSFLDRVQFSQHGLQFVFLLLKIQLHTIDNTCTVPARVTISCVLPRPI